MADKQIDLTKAFELRGRWWLPGNENHQIFGILKFDPAADFNLELDGWLDPNRKPFTAKPFSPPVIHGVTREGVKCSLLKSFERKSTFYTAGTQTSILHVNLAIIGTFIPSFENTCFRSSSVRYTNLEAWIGRSGLSQQTDYLKGGKKSWSIAYSSPNIVKYPVPEIQSTLSFVPWSQMSFDNYSGTLSQSESIGIRPKSKKNIEWFLSVAHHLRNLLSLFAAERFFYRSFRLEIERKKLPHFNKMVKMEADLVFRQNYFGEVRSIGPPEVPFPYPVVRKDLKNILSFWFKGQNVLKPVHDLFFGTMYNLQIGAEFQFLSMTQALESLHRHLHRGRYISKKTYERCKQALTSAIPSGTPNDLREALKTRIKYGNEHSLSKRLTLMGRNLNAKTRQLIHPDYKAFISRCVDTRNYLTHYDPALKTKAMSNLEMFEATFCLRLLLTIYLFKEIGMREQVITEVIGSHKKFKKPELLP